MHPLTRANYLASPPLVVAYALAGTVGGAQLTAIHGRVTLGGFDYLRFCIHWRVQYCLSVKFQFKSPTLTSNVPRSYRKVPRIPKP